MTGIRIDWHAGTWRLWDIVTGCKLDECGHLSVLCPIEFVNDENNTRGFGVTCGVIRKTGNRIVIEVPTNGES